MYEDMASSLLRSTDHPDGKDAIIGTSELMEKAERPVVCLSSMVTANNSAVFCGLSMCKVPTCI